MDPPGAPLVDHPFVGVLCAAQASVALRATATHRRGPDQEVDVKKISDCGGRMT